VPLVQLLVRSLADPTHGAVVQYQDFESDYEAVKRKKKRVRKKVVKPAPLPKPADGLSLAEVLDPYWSWKMIRGKF
jgi:hypothetical protein